MWIAGPVLWTWQMTPTAAAPVPTARSIVQPGDLIVGHHPQSVGAQILAEATDPSAGENHLPVRIRGLISVPQVVEQDPRS